jgi:hypothetical protein
VSCCRPLPVSLRRLLAPCFCHEMASLASLVTNSEEMAFGSSRIFKQVERSQKVWPAVRDTTCLFTVARSLALKKCRLYGASHLTPPFSLGAEPVRSRHLTTAGAGFTHGRAFCLVSRELRPQGTLISHGGGFARGRSGDEGRETEHVSRQRAPSALVVRTRCRRDACG